MIRRRAPLVLALALAAVAIGAGIATLPTILGGGPPVGGPGPTLTASPAIADASPTAAGTPAPSPVPTVAPTPTPPPASSILDRGQIVDRLQAMLERDRATLAAPGLTAAILFADGRSWSGTAGVADLETGRALTVDTPFPLASISKTFLAAEILDLVASGSLRLDESVAKLLPKVTVGGRALDPRITIRELLDHTSGLGDFLTDRKLGLAAEADPTKAWTPTMALAYAGKPFSQPGVGYHYSNTNYVLLGLIAQHATGRTLAQEYRRRFFGPLGLKSAFYQFAEKPTAMLPTAYHYNTLKLAEVPADITDGTDVRPFTAITTAAGAAGSIAASAPDLAAWARALYGGNVLPAAMKAAMVADATATSGLKPGYPYGLGVQAFVIDGQLTYGHSGRLVGARSAVRWFPAEGIAIAVLTNESRFDPGIVVADLLDVVAPIGTGIQRISDPRRS